jgi:hypothetical protein
MKQMTSLENRIAVVTKYKNLWQEYFRFFADGFDDRKITPQDEQGFFQLMQALATNHFRFVEMAGSVFKDGGMILDILTETVSLGTLKQMSEAQFGKLLIDWHTVFINMNKALGKLNMQRPQPKK